MFPLSLFSFFFPDFESSPYTFVNVATPVPRNSLASRSPVIRYLRPRPQGTDGLESSLPHFLSFLIFFCLGCVFFIPYFPIEIAFGSDAKVQVLGESWQRAPVFFSLHGTNFFFCIEYSPSLSLGPVPFAPFRFHSLRVLSDCLSGGWPDDAVHLAIASRFVIRNPDCSLLFEYPYFFLPGQATIDPVAFQNGRGWRAGPF